MQSVIMRRTFFFFFCDKHLYVIYRTFWALDTAHDLYIDLKDTTTSNRINERLFCGSVSQGNAVQREGRMSCGEFVWFLVSEEDKKDPTSVKY